MSNEQNRVFPTAEAKAINLFNEALVNLTFCDFPSLIERRNKAKANCHLLITNIKIALYETSYHDNVPISAIKNTEAYYSRVRLIIEKF